MVPIPRWLTSLIIPPLAAVFGMFMERIGPLRISLLLFVTPWNVSVASGYALLRDPHFNKGLAFTEKERDAHYLRGLLPPTVICQETQVHHLIIHSPSEENDPKHNTISGSITEVHGDDGSSGEENTILFCHPNSR